MQPHLITDELDPNNLLMMIKIRGKAKKEPYTRVKARPTYPKLKVILLSLLFSMFFKTSHKLSDISSINTRLEDTQNGPYKSGFSSIASAS